MANSKVIVCFGDSNTEGGYRGGVGHPSSLAGMVKGYKVVNAGVGGETTARGLARITGILQLYQPRYVLILEGTNDVNGGVSAATVAANLGAMADIVRRYGGIPLVATLPPNTRYAAGKSVPTYNKAIAEMAAKRNIPLVDAYSLLLDDWADLNSDGLHYNAAGARIVAAGFAEALGDYIGKLVTGTKGDDVLTGGRGDDTIKGLVGNDALYGKAGNDLLKGGRGDDTLFGGKGRDTLKGGAGNDLLWGGAGKDKLYGGRGDDTLIGGKGKDTLQGGPGRDLFVFNTRPGKNNVDVIVDFTVGEDTIQLAQGIFAQLAEGGLSAENFRANKKGVAKDDNDYIIYNTKTGALLYDRDGKGGAAAVQFARLKNRPQALSAADFLVASEVG